MNAPTVSEEIADTAIEWFVRLRAENVTDKECELFVGWLNAAKEHQRAFTDVLIMWDGLSVVENMSCLSSS